MVWACLHCSAWFQDSGLLIEKSLQRIREGSYEIDDPIWLLMNNYRNQHYHWYCSYNYFLLVTVYYLGHGKRDTGDWCFQDGFITFSDIAELYSRYLRG